MTVTEVKLKSDKTAEDREAIPSLDPTSYEPARRRRRKLPFLITLAAVALAGVLGWAAWGIYMGSPWTRDATVRAYVVTMAPEVAGRIVEPHVVDNGYVRKGDLLMVIDPTNYTIAVNQAEAAVQQAQASVQNIDAQIAVQRAQISASEIVISGTTRHTPSGVLSMPAFGGIYSDAEIAAVANYVTQRFGNERATISDKDVAELRNQTSH
jgi:multidrug resistance efflux pump